MKAPFILVEGQDVTLFATLEALERYIESPDIDCFRVFDADGMRLDLTVVTSQPSRRAGIGWVEIVEAKASPKVPIEWDQDSLAAILSDHLERVTGKPREPRSLDLLLLELSPYVQVA